MRYRTRRLPNHCVWKIAILSLSLSLFLSFSFIFLYIDFLRFLLRFNDERDQRFFVVSENESVSESDVQSRSQVDRSCCGWNERDLIGSFEIQFGEPRWKLDEIIRSKTVTLLERSRLPINASPQYRNCERAVFPRRTAAEEHDLCSRWPISHPRRHCSIRFDLRSILGRVTIDTIDHHDQQHSSSSWKRDRERRGTRARALGIRVDALDDLAFRFAGSENLELQVSLNSDNARSRSREKPRVGWLTRDHQTEP